MNKQWNENQRVFSGRNLYFLQDTIGSSRKNGGNISQLLIIGEFNEKIENQQQGEGGIIGKSN